MSTARERGEHGSPTVYRQGCRCSRCRRAQRRYGQVLWASYKLRAGRRDVATKVSPARMLAHLDALAAAGVSAHQVALRAGVSPSTLSRARRRGVRVSRIVVAAVCAVQL